MKYYRQEMYFTREGDFPVLYKVEGENCWCFVVGRSTEWEDSFLWGDIEEFPEITEEEATMLIWGASN